MDIEDMDDDIEIEDDLGEEDDEPIGVVDEIIRGLPDDARKAFDATFIRKSELTRMRQRDREDIASLRQEVQSIRQGGAPQQPANGNGAPGPNWASTFKKHGVEENSPLWGLMQEFGQQVAELAVQRSQQVNAPLVNSMIQTEKQRYFVTEKEKLANTFGKGVEKYWPKLQQLMDAHLQKTGIAVDAKWLFQEKFPERSEELLLQQAARRRDKKVQRAGRTSMEGFATMRYSKMPGSDERGSGEKPKLRLEENGDRVAQLAQEALREVGMTR